MNNSFVARSVDLVDGAGAKVRVWIQDEAPENQKKGDIKFLDNKYSTSTCCSINKVVDQSNQKWAGMIRNIAAVSAAQFATLNAAFPDLRLSSSAPSAPPASSPTVQTTIAPVVTPTEEAPEEEKFYQKDWFMPVAIGLGIALIGGTAAFFIARSGGSSAPAMA